MDGWINGVQCSNGINGWMDGSMDVVHTQDTFDIRVLMAKPVGHTFDFQTISESSLHS